MNKINIFKNTSILLYAQIITVLTSLIYFAVLARVFTKEEYGAFSQIFILITIGIVIFSFSIPLSIQYFVGQTNVREEKEKILNQIINVCLILCSLAFTVIYISYPYLAINIFDNKEIIPLKIFVVLLVISQVISSTFDYTFVTLNKLKLVFYRKTFFSLFKLMITYITFINNLSLYYFLLLLTILELLFAFYTFFAIKKEITHYSFNINFKIVKNIFTYSYPLAIAAILAILNVEFSKIFVSINYDINIFAKYSLVSRELPLYIVGTSLTAVLIPIISSKFREKKIEEALKIWHSSIELSLIATVWMIGLLIVMAKEVVIVLYSDKYVDGYLIFIVYTIILLTKVVYFGLIIRSTGKTNLLLYSSIFSILLTIILTIIMSSLFGIIGVAIAVLMSSFFTGLLQLILSAKLIKVSFRNIFPWQTIFNIILVNLVIGMLIFGLKMISGNFFTHNLLSILIFSLIWFIVLIRFYFNRLKILKRVLS